MRRWALYAHDSKLYTCAFPTQLLRHFTWFDPLLFSIFFPLSLLKHHTTLDCGANDMPTTPECFHCGFVAFIMRRDQISGGGIGVAGITITLPPPRKPPPTPSPQILPALARLNGQNPRADWYIGARRRGCEARASPSPSTRAVAAITSPSVLLSILASLPELPRWQVINPYRHGSGGFTGWVEGVRQMQHKPEGDFCSCIESCFPLTDNVSLGYATANSLHAKQSLPLSLSPFLSLSAWIAPSRCANGARVLGNLWRGIKGGEQRLTEFATLPIIQMILNANYPPQLCREQPVSQDVAGVCRASRSNRLGLTLEQRRATT